MERPTKRYSVSTENEATRSFADYFDAYEYALSGIGALKDHAAPKLTCRDADGEDIRSYINTKPDIHTWQLSYNGANAFIDLSVISANRQANDSEVVVKFPILESFVVTDDESAEMSSHFAVLANMVAASTGCSETLQYLLQARNRTVKHIQMEHKR